MAATIADLLKTAQLLNFELIYIRQYVTNWGPEIAKDLWPDGKPSPRERCAQEKLADAETSYAKKVPAPSPSVTSKPQS